MDNVKRTAAARAVVDAIGDSDWDRVTGALAPGFRYIELGTGRTLEGPAAFVEAMAGWKTAFPDVRGTVSEVTVTDDTVAVELLWVGTHKGAFEGLGRTLEPTGIRQSTPAALFMVFTGDKITETRQYFDMVGLYQQIGALS